MGSVVGYLHDVLFDSEGRNVGGLSARLPVTRLCDSLICSTIVKRFYGLSMNPVEYIGFTWLLGIPALASFPEAG